LIPEIESGLSREALALRSFEHEPAFNEEKAQAAAALYGYAYQTKSVVSGMLGLLVTKQSTSKQPKVAQIEDFKRAHQGTGDQSSKREDQLRGAASLSSYFDEPTAKVG
jgi:hypothetical protein